MDDPEDPAPLVSLVATNRNPSMDPSPVDRVPQLCGFGSEDENLAALSSLEWNTLLAEGGL